MKKFQKDLNNSTFMYQGRTVTASNHTTDHKKKNVTLKSLGIGNKSVAELNAKSTCTCMYLFFIQLNLYEAATLYKWPVIKVVQCIVLWTSIEWPTLIKWPLAGTPRLAALWRFYCIICSWWFWWTDKTGSARVFGYTVYRGFLNRVYGILQLKYGYSVYHFLWISGIKYTFD